MKIIIKLFFLSVLFSILAIRLNAITVFSNDTNKIDITGQFNIAYFNRLSSEHTYDFIKNNRYHSQLGILAENKTLKGLTTRLFFEARINNKFYYPEDIDKNYYESLEVNQIYLELEDSLGKTRLGNFNSQVYYNTVATTDKSYVFLLDAGYSFVGQSSSSFGNYNDSDFSTKAVYQGIGHYNQYGNVVIAVEVESPRNNLQARNDFEEDTFDTKAFNQKFTAATSLSYKGEKVGISAGYKRIQNEQRTNFSGLSFNDNMLVSDNILSSFYLSLNKFYLALAGGYYKNLKIAGIDHVGASAFMQYKLTKLTPYIGYQFLYADDINKNGHIYGLADNKNYSFDQSVAVVGLSYNVYDGLTVGIEHNNDVRSKGQRESSLLNNVNNDITAIYFKYSL
ncbi:MAG: hypothetical protein LBH40_05320 [Alphaproteobacteria bacterium]|jgi:hypothetical protein|nr:hypothetical protein [Alphaproteobacteria bacterium]